MDSRSFIRLLAVAAIALLNGIWINAEKVSALHDMSYDIPQFDIQKLLLEADESEE